MRAVRGNLAAAVTHGKAMRQCWLAVPILILSLISAVGCVSQPAESTDNKSSNQPRVRIYSRSEELPPLEKETKAGEIVFSTVPAAAEVAINGRSVGKSPLRFPLSDGSYSIRMQKQRYHPATFFLDIQNDDVAAVRVDLQPFTGAIDPRIRPEDAELRLGELRIDEFPLELPVGIYTLEVRRFGYQTLSRSVEVKRNQTARPELILQPAPFVLKQFALQPKRLRHTPPLPAPRVQLHGRLSAPGTVDIEIWNADGKLVGSQQINLQSEPEFSSSFELTAGSYRVTISARGEQQSGTVLLERQIKVEAENSVSLLSNAVPRAQSLPSGMLRSGLVFSGGGTAYAAPSHFPSQFSLAAGLPYAFEVQGSARFSIQRQEKPFWRTAARVKKEIASTGGAVELAGALQLSGAFSTGSDNEDAGFQAGLNSGLAAGPILELRYSPQAETLLGAGISPTVQWDFNSESSRKWDGALHSGIFAQTDAWGYALSACTQFNISRIWYGMELSRLIPGTSMHITFSAGAVTEDHLIDYYTGGIGFYYIR